VVRLPASRSGDRGDCRMRTVTFKLLAARAQLGTALALFLEDAEPYSIHCLACSSGEVLSGHLAGGEPSFTDLITDYGKAADPRAVERARKQYVNALKHFATRKGEPRYGDEGLLRGFSDNLNDAVLFHAWFDYGQIMRSKPLEAQVFEAWFLSKLGWLAKDYANRVFPGLLISERADQKSILRAAIASAHAEPRFGTSSKTERLPLKLSLGQISDLRALVSTPPT